MKKASEILKRKAGRIVESVKASELLSQKRATALSFAYPCDGHIDAVLSNGLVRKSLQLFSDKYCKRQIQNIKTTGQLVTSVNYPRLYKILQGCCESLKITTLPDMYITPQLSGINALSVGTDAHPIVMVSRKAVMCLSDGELRFLLGHELGHILQQNMMCHTIKGVLDMINDKSAALGVIVSDLIDIPLNKWYRCAEFTADKAGYICCGDIASVKSIFGKTARHRSESGYGDFMELYQNHPLVKTRIEKIEEFAKTM